MRSSSHQPLSSNVGDLAAWRCVGSRLIVALAAAAMVACSTTPPTVRLHSLIDSHSSFAPANSKPAFDPAIRLSLAPIVVPIAVDQPQWLVRRADDSLQMLEQDRWAAPLADELKAALRARLSSHWNVVDATVPSRGKSLPEGFAWRLVLEILRLDARPAVDVQLEARWTWLAPKAGSADVTCGLRIVEPVRGQGTLPIADAYRRATLRLADQIGAEVRADQRNGMRTCGTVGPS